MQAMRSQFIRRLLIGAATLAAGFGANQAVAAERHQPTVVELFTSQGCSSCPPANANAAALSERPDILVLSFGVTYWDYLGWKDTFAQPQFTERQRTYEPALGHDGPFTPQIVVNGSHDVVGNRRGELEALVTASPLANAPGVELTERSVAIAAGPAPLQPADVWLVRYDPRRVDVPVGRGENGGRTLPHKNVVHELERLGQWRGKAIELPLPATTEELRTAVLVQLPRGGTILAAATN